MPSGFRQRGASLVELIVALVVFAVAMGALAGVIPTSWLIEDSARVNEFVWEARSCAEEIIALTENEAGFDIDGDCPDSGGVVDPTNWGVEPGHCTGGASLEIRCEHYDSEGYYQMRISCTGCTDSEVEPVVLQIPEGS